MKTSDTFKSVIQTYLEYRASTDELFAPRYANPNKNIDDCCTYILNQVQKSGMNGFDDAEIYSLAVDYYNEEEIEVGKPIQCKVLVNTHIELTKAEKAEARRKAVEQYQQAELRKMQKRNKPKNTASKTEVAPSLFDF